MTGNQEKTKEKGKPSELWYDVRRLGERIDKDAKAFAERIDGRKEKIVDGAINSIKRINEEVKKKTGVTFLKEIKRVEIDLDYLIGSFDEEEEIEEEGKLSWVQKIVGVFR